MKRLKHILCFVFALVAAFAATSCGDDHKIPDWEWPDPATPDPETPSVTLKPRYICIDACANFPDYANSKANIASDLAKVAAAGFTDIVVDVRPSMGDVLFNTSLVAQVKKLDVWKGSRYYFYERTATWDYLQAFIDAGHAAGLKVHAAINTFVGGCHYPYGLGQQGMLFRDDTRRNWATVVNTADGLKNVMDISDDAYGTKFLNPVDTEVRAFLIGLLKDLAAYNVDGIFLDRCRYDDLACDFSETSRKAFEKYIGQTITNFPTDIIAAGANSLPYYVPTMLKRWLEFRAKNIHDFVESAAAAVKSVNPKIQFGAYVGGWYSSYYYSGVNWASPSYDTSKYYDWATSTYKNYGYADHLDFLLVGAYASASRIYGTTEWTVEGFCRVADRVLMNAVPFAGGPDVGNWDTSGCTDIGAAVTSTVDACMGVADGYFVFDLIHVKMYDYWDELKAGIDAYVASAKAK